MEELAVQLGQAGLEDGAVLQGEGQLPPDQISVFNSLRQQYAVNLNLLDVPFSPCKVLPSTGPPERERMASKQGMIGVNLGDQKGQVPQIGCVEPETTRKRKGGGKGARANTLASVFDMSMSLSAFQGVTLPPETDTPVDFIANRSMDHHKTTYFVEEQVIIEFIVK